MSRTEFEHFISTANPDTVSVCGIELTQLEILKALPEHYLGLFEAWSESEEQNEVA